MIEDIRKSLGSLNWPDEGPDHGPVSEDLKPCPFCGKPAELRTSPNGRRYRVKCSDYTCYNTPNFALTKGDAVAWWNTRPFEDDQRAELAAARTLFTEWKTGDMRHDWNDYEERVDEWLAAHDETA